MSDHMSPPFRCWKVVVLNVITTLLVQITGTPTPKALMLVHRSLYRSIVKLEESF